MNILSKDAIENYKKHLIDEEKSKDIYYKKDESKESVMYPSGENISNIQEYVQYRIK